MMTAAFQVGTMAQGLLLRVAGLAGLALAAWLLVALGRRLSRLAPPLKAEEARVSPGVLALVPGFAAFGAGALVMKWLSVEKWGGPTALWLAGLCFAIAVVQLVVGLLWRIEITRDALTLVRPPFPKRLVRYAVMDAWWVDGQQQVVLQLSRGRRLKLSPMFMEGFDQIPAALESHLVPKSAKPGPTEG